MSYLCNNCRGWVYELGDTISYGEDDVECECFMQDENNWKSRAEKAEAEVERLEQEARLRFIKDVNGRIKELIEFAERSPDLWEYFKATNTDIVDELIEILAKAEGGAK